MHIDLATASAPAKRLMRVVRCIEEHLEGMQDMNIQVRRIVPARTAPG